ncbi:MAG: CPBP family intramembrane metalloprotease [Chloroflexota bacterium]|nr:CPBP family intramembrane metalloprotease [Chloroflexota bacterium]
MDTIPRMSDRPLEQPQDVKRKWFSWKVFSILLVASAVVSLMALPYTLIQLKYPASSIALLTVAQTAEFVVISAIAIIIGLRLGGPIGLGVPMLRDWLAGDPAAPRQFRTALPWAIGLGVLAALVITGMVDFLGPLVGLRAQQSSSVHLPVWQVFLESLYAPINEELWFRLGIMTLLAWLGTRLFRRQKPSTVIAWIAIILSALLFGAYHLPLYSSITLGAIVLATLYNGAAGVIFGWLYWRKGLLLAMVAHFCADITLHIILPALGLVR